MEVICIEDSAFFALIEKVLAHVNRESSEVHDIWVSGEEAMHMMRITSKTTLQKLRDEGKIRFSQPEKKIILYDSRSINEYLNKHSKNTF